MQTSFPVVPHARLWSLSWLQVLTSGVTHASWCAHDLACCLIMAETALCSVGIYERLSTMNLGRRQIQARDEANRPNFWLGNRRSDDLRASVPHLPPGEKKGRPKFRAHRRLRSAKCTCSTSCPSLICDRFENAQDVHSTRLECFRPNRLPG
jgi:hypothetical protein